MLSVHRPRYHIHSTVSKYAELTASIGALLVSSAPCMSALLPPSILIEVFCQMGSIFSVLYEFCYFCRENSFVLALLGYGEVSKGGFQWRGRRTEQLISPCTDPDLRYAPRVPSAASRRVITAYLSDPQSKRFSSPHSLCTIQAGS